MSIPIKIHENIEAERERVQDCIQKFGWTSDHNLDWFMDAIMTEDTIPVFVEFEDGSGILAHKKSDQWRIWSDPLCDKSQAPEKIEAFSLHVLNNGAQEVWCDDLSKGIHSALTEKDNLKVNEVYYSLSWPVLDMDQYDPALPGGRFKEMRNAKNKFSKEHKLEVINANECKKESLHLIVENWKQAISHKEDIYDLKYRRAIDNNFKGFKTARILVVDGRPVGFNAGYEVPNQSGRFAGVIGIHDYSVQDLGTILWLEDLEWIKNAGYGELDMQGDEGGGLEFKMQFNPIIERKTDTFSITKK